MTEAPPAKGERLVSGFLYRRIPNTVGRWDPVAGLPGKLAFAPGRDRDTGVKETGISTYLVRLTSVKEVLDGHDPEFGVVVIDIAELHAAIEGLRPLMGTGRGKVAPFGEFTVTFDPSGNGRDGAARHAHCWINPMQAAIQKELVRLTSPARVEKPCGPLRVNTGTADP